MIFLYKPLKEKEMPKNKGYPKGYAVKPVKKTKKKK